MGEKNTILAILFYSLYFSLSFPLPLSTLNAILKNLSEKATY